MFLFLFLTYFYKYFIKSQFLKESKFFRVIKFIYNKQLFLLEKNNESQIFDFNFAFYYLTNHNIR